VVAHGKPVFSNAVSYQLQVRTSWHWYYMSVSDEAGLTPGDRLVVLQKPIDIEQLLRILRKFTGPEAAE
jgi:hypothetical protein